MTDLNRTEQTGSELESQVQRLAATWETLPTDERAAALRQLKDARQQTPLPDGSELHQRLTALEADIELSIGLEPPSPEQGVKA